MSGCHGGKDAEVQSVHLGLPLDPKPSPAPDHSLR